VSRLKLSKFGAGFLSGVIITDTETNKNVELMAMQLKALIRDPESGTFPHGGYDQEGDVITVYHDDDREKHEVSFTLEELNETLEGAIANGKN